MDINEEEAKQITMLKANLSGHGFIFDSEGNISNYQEKLKELTEWVESWKKTSEEAKDNEAFKLAYEDAEDTLQSIRKYLDEFFDSQNDGMLGTTEKWYEYENAIIEAREEIEALSRELRLLPLENTAIELTHSIKNFENQLEHLDETYKYAEGEEYLLYQNEKIKTLQEQLKYIEQQQYRLQQLQKGMANELVPYGFIFNNEGLIHNYDEVLNSLVGSSAYENVKDLADEYMDLVTGDLAEIGLEALKANNAIKDIHNGLREMEEEAEEARKKAEEERLESLRDNLEKTKKIEDEITEIYEKEYDRIKKEIEDFTDAQIKLLKKQKDAYNEMREEQDYEKGARERVDEIEELRRKL